jgi:hypothetical protein
MRHTWRALLASVNELNARLGDGEQSKGRRMQPWLAE